MNHLTLREKLWVYPRTMRDHLKQDLIWSWILLVRQDERKLINNWKHEMKAKYGASEWRKQQKAHRRFKWLFDTYSRVARWSKSTPNRSAELFELRDKLYSECFGK